MKLYNTRTRALEDFSPLEGKQVRIYSCGPTVYDHAHIGNLSAYIFADTLRRTVAQAGYKVVHAMNYTDVDDKTIRRSQALFTAEDPKVALRKLTDKYIELFLDDMQKIGNDTTALTFLRATDPRVLQGMQGLITQLVDNGFAYIAEDGIYFSIEAYRKSGKAYGQLLKLTLGNTSAARIQNDEYDKASAHDFVLWKKQKENEPAWAFTLNGQDITGRPGWHIECSVMSRQALGQPFDIHTAGVDLIFPHNENEIAQSTAGEANPLMANVFVHNEHLLVDGHKMAKSAHNFYTLQDIMAQGYDPLAFRLMVLQSHYRSQLNFSWKALAAAQNRLKDLCALSALRYQPVRQTSHKGTWDFSVRLREIKAHMENDLATPDALSIDLSSVEKAEQPSDTRSSQVRLDMMEGVPEHQIPALTQYIQTLDVYLGLDLMSVADIDEAHKHLIKVREQARQKKDWNTSDELRSQLENEGIGLRDTPHGTIWYWLQ